jgi:hypothetical protein
VVGQVALTGPLAEAAGLARFAAPAARYVPLRGGGFVEATQAVGREVAAVAGAGATSGVGTQALGDAITGHRSTFEDYLAAAEAGAMEARLARKFSPVLTGALGSGATSITQDLMNDRAISAEDALTSSALGGVGGYVGNWVGELTEQASRAVKGDMGEVLMKLRTLARGDGLSKGPWQYNLPHGGVTVPDGYIRDGLSEAKFGPHAKLSVRQQQAKSLPDIKYRLDQFLPRDVGALLGVPGSQLASEVGQDEFQERRHPAIRFSR